MPYIVHDLNNALQMLALAEQGPGIFYRLTRSEMYAVRHRIEAARDAVDRAPVEHLVLLQVQLERTRAQIWRCYLSPGWSPGLAQYDAPSPPPCRNPDCWCNLSEDQRQVRLGEAFRTVVKEWLG
jgi:hypothetical protein